MTLVTAADMIHINVMRLFLGFLLCFFVCAATCHAQQHKGELKKVETTLQTKKQKQQELQEKQATIEKKLEAMRSELINVSTDIQNHERVMLKLHDAQAETNAHIEVAAGKLEIQRKSLAETIIALQRLNRMPPQALLARPSAPIDMARSFGLLQKVIPAVSEKAQEIEVAFHELQELQDNQKRQEQELAVEKEKLDIRQAELEKIVKKRQALLQDNQKQQQTASQEVASLANRAQNLKDLITKIDRQSAARKAAQEKAANTLAIAETPDTPVNETPKIIHKMKDWLGAVVNKTGNARLPVTGHIATAFGQRAGEGIVSQGIVIAAQSGAIVTAPSGGTIRFAGPFRQYKLLVIIQHPNGEHSLLGGMQELYTRTGAHVDAGEPLGKLPNNNHGDSKMAGDSSAQTSLYYERRRNGKPIDPRVARG